MAKFFVTATLTRKYIIECKAKSGAEAGMIAGNVLNAINNTPAEDPTNIDGLVNSVQMSDINEIQEIEEV